MLQRVALFAVQTEEYADRLKQLGVAPGRAHVTGNVKYDGVETSRHNSRTRPLRELTAAA